ncbi:MAG: putative toxin-antitoxin system toxin component, PIN family [Deltaproteobacteria bacterium]|nr:putative toxin-antitoxin system toxin component, PIN family [Deltaproteobacteria bacterium]
MKVIIDTNVAVSGLLWSGPPNRIMRWIRDGLLTAYGCEKTTQELNKTLNYVKFSKRFRELNLTQEEVFAYFMNLIQYVPIPKNIPGIIKKDPFDNIFLALAVQNNVSLIISGDDHLLSKKEYKNIQIVTPQEACEVIEAFKKIG